MSIIETEVVDDIIEVREPVFNHNKKDTHIYGVIPEEYYKVMGEVSSRLKLNGLCDILWQ